MMPKASKDVQPGDYVAMVLVRAKNYANVVSKFAVVPTRVYRSGARQSIEYLNSAGEPAVLDNYAGASSFELYKRV